jgi:hypothetical protein
VKARQSDPRCPLLAAVSTSMAWAIMKLMTMYTLPVRVQYRRRRKELIRP